MKKFIKIAFVSLTALSILLFSGVYILEQNIADNYKVNKGEELVIDAPVPVTASFKGVEMSNVNARNIGETFSVDLKIFGVIPFSTVDVEVVDKMYVTVLGNPFGMKIYTEGVLVIETADITTEQGIINPAKEAGIKVGDYIKSVNGAAVDCNEDVAEMVAQSGGNQMLFEIVRNGKNKKVPIKPVLSKDDGIYRVGIWVRDSSAGVGTLTFYSPAANVICGLGHGICDSDTKTLLEIDSGELVTADIVSYTKGTSGSPGELKGKFNYETISDIALNCSGGVYGIPTAPIESHNLTPVALKQEITEGEAQILCTINGDTPKLHSCTVKFKNSTYMAATQNLIVTVTDSELLKTTGGIVQGMSGSPIIQNGKLIGAITHVFVDDPTKGYGIFAENMLETAQGVAKENLKEAS